ncbi:MAG: hypothetical protein WCK05_01625, partial [Planctomycetota bacterium]
STCFDLAGAITESGYDFHAFDEQMRVILGINPAALVMPRVGLIPSQAWLDANPDERMVHLNLQTNQFVARGGAHVSFNSLTWHAQMQPALRAFVLHAEERFGENIAGYHVAGGDCGEWSYIWAEMLSDFSKPQQEAYRRWLTGRYGIDAAVQAAWGDPQATLVGAEVPRDRVRPAGAGSILDPVKERRISDYLEFHSDTVAERIERFAGVAKDALREAGRTKIVAAFYGYHFWFSRFTTGYHDSGHHALARVLACPHVDAICAPGNYQDRHPGAMFSSQLIAGSVRLHGKLFYNEDDTRTFLTEPKAAWGRCPDLAGTVGVLERNVCGALTGGGTNWWMDQGGGWYHDAELMAAIGRMQRLAEGLLEGDRSSRAQVAVIVSQETSRYMWYDAALTESALIMQLAELGAMGAPFEVYDASDLERLFTGPDAAHVKLVIFLNCLYLSPGQRQAIHSHVARDGRTLLWVHAAGLVTEQGVSTDAMAELTGIRTGVYYMPWQAEVVTYLTGDRVTYGTHEIVGPVLYGDDPDARVHGWARLHVRRDPDMPGLLEKPMPGWWSFWSAAPNMPATLLRAIAQSAGVHVYSDAGDQVFAGPGLLAVHAAFDGQRTIRLPSRRPIRDAFTGEVFPPADEVALTMRRGETRVWRL